jgi:hypothetical protein
VFNRRRSRFEDDPEPAAATVHVDFGAPVPRDINSDLEGNELPD